MLGKVVFPLFFSTLGGFEMKCFRVFLFMSSLFFLAGALSASDDAPALDEWQPLTLVGLSEALEAAEFQFSQGNHDTVFEALENIHGSLTYLLNLETEEEILEDDESAGNSEDDANYFLFLLVQGFNELCQSLVSHYEGQEPESTKIDCCEEMLIELDFEDELPSLEKIEGDLEGIEERLNQDDYAYIQIVTLGQAFDSLDSFEDEDFKKVELLEKIGGLALRFGDYYNEHHEALALKLCPRLLGLTEESETLREKWPLLEE